MDKLLVLALLSLPSAAAAQGPNAADLAALPGLMDMRDEVLENPAPVQRPDPQKTVSEITALLRLSPKQEERISAAVGKKTSQFDRLMKEFEKSSAEESRWRDKKNESHAGMVRLDRELPDVVREFLDNDQRQKYDAMREAKKKASAPAPAAAPAPSAASVPAQTAVAPASGAAAGAVTPRKKRRVLRRRKKRAAAAPAAAVPAVEEEAGGVMVDNESSAPRAANKRRAQRRPAAAPIEEAAEPSNAAPAGKEALPEDEDLETYP